MRALILATAIGILVFALFPHFVADEVWGFLLHEDGAFEWVAAACWLLAALAALLRRSPPNGLLVAYGIVFLMLAERESSLLAGFAGGGKRYVRIAYYLGDSPLVERLLVALLLLACVAALIAAGLGSLRELRQPREFDRPELHYLIAAVGILVLSQLCEPAQDWFRDWGALALPIARSLWSVEEGLEVVAPFVVAVVLAGPRWRRRQRT